MRFLGKGVLALLVAGPGAVPPADCRRALVNTQTERRRHPNLHPVRLLLFDFGPYLPAQLAPAVTSSPAQ